MRAVEAASDSLYRSRSAGDGRAETSPKQRRADAIGLVAERAMAAGFEASAAPGTEGDEPESASGKAVAERGEEQAPSPISGTRAERYQVMLHVERATLGAETEPGRSELSDGTRVSAETSRRLACDAALVRVERSDEGAVLDVGRRTRTIPPALRRALEVRDRGCLFPGCGIRFTDAHHIRHWADGGPTSLANCLLLCRFHHRLVHEEGWRVVVSAAGSPVFLDPRGGSHLPAPIGGALDPARTPNGPDPARELVRRNRERGVDPHAHTASARWKRDADVPDEVCFRALEAVVAGRGG